MDILVCFDHNFVMPTGVMLYSLIANNLEVEIRCHCIVDKSVTDPDKLSLEEIIKRNPGNKIFFYEFKTSLIDRFPGLKGTAFNKSVYYRLFCPSILPGDISKILYLDSDMIITSSIRKLWEENIDEYYVAGVINPFVKGYELLKFVRQGYINNGVLLINLNKWRENQTENLFADFMAHQAGLIKLADQDVLNAVLDGHKKFLSLKYNFLHKFLFKDKYIFSDIKNQLSELEDARHNPVIVHFTGPVKPWMKGCLNPYANLFLQYKRMTVWKDATFDGTINSRKKKLLFVFIREMVSFLKIRRTSVSYYDMHLISELKKSEYAG